jgi:hypothetical protein
MVLLDFSINLPSPIENLFKIITNFEGLSNFAPDQIKQVKILNVENNFTTTEETFLFSSVIKKQIIQQTLHEIILDKKLKSKIIEGPAKDTTIELIFEKNDTNTQIMVNIDLKLKFYLRVFQPLIKKHYKSVLTGIFYKINSEAKGYTINN